MALPKDRPKVITGVTGENCVDKFNNLLSEMEANPEIQEKLQAQMVGNPISLGSRVLDADEWADKMVNRASAASSDWLKNVKRPRRNPIEAAIKANGKRKDKLAEAEKQEKWLKKMQKVDADEMYATIEAVGEAGFRSGIEARRGKVKKVINELQPMVAAVAATIDAMPDATDADREKRLLAARKLMIEVGKKRASS